MRSWCVNCPNWYPIERKKKEVGQLFSFVWQLPFNTSPCCLATMYHSEESSELQQQPFDGSSVTMAWHQRAANIVWKWPFRVLLSCHTGLWRARYLSPFFRCSNCSLRAKLWTAMNLDSQMNAVVVLRFLLYLHSMLSSLRNNGIRSTKNQKWWLTGGGQCEKGEKSHQIAKV